MQRLFAPTAIEPLVWFRIAFGVLMLVEVCRYFAYKWIYTDFIEPTFFFTYYGFGKDSPRFLITIALATLLFWIIALAGMWRGYRTRLKAYVGYLLKRLPPNSQKAVVDLVYQEAAMQPAN